MITRKVSPALAAGCTVMIKPANETPFSALAERAGVPKGVLNIVTSDASAIGLVLCEHPAVRFVGFTGSGLNSVATRRSAALRNQASAAKARITAWKSMSRSNTS
ncbi:MAG: succinate-semialdehyde dehydrogenase [Tardiphaga sp.]|nr:succinate-semialdehyde dehydrogenase [Tardiphaga sp.]